MNGVGYSIIGFLIAITVLVTVHEFGHFWVARKLGVKVLKFSIGLGKSIFCWRKKQDSTEYSIGIIPLGGYVKMLDECEGHVSEGEKKQAFNQQSLSVRTAIVAAGPIFNFLFAIFAMWMVFIAGSNDIEPVIGEVVLQSIAEQTGFSTGDRLISLNGREVETWGQYQLYLLHQAMKGNKVTIKVVSATGIFRELVLDFSTLNQSEITTQSITAHIGVWPPHPPAEVQKIAENSPASEAGLMSGDRIVSIDDKPIENWFELVKEVSSRPGEKMNLTVNRNGQRMAILLTTNSISMDGKEYGQIGLYRPELHGVSLRYSPLEAIWRSLEYNWWMTVITLRSLGRMLTAQISSKSLSGPITIARIAGHTVGASYADFFKFLASISISLGLLNLMPIPVLDGGHLLYFAIEAVIGKSPPEKFIMLGQQIGIFFLVMLMGLALYNDIMRLL